jgi:hypothetical protein
MRWLRIALAALVACTHKDAQSVAKTRIDSMTNALAKLGDTTKLHGGPADHGYGPPTGKIRVANLLEINGQPSGPVDLYEMRNPDSATAPLIKNLSFGQVSDYVSPRAGGNYKGSTSNLYMFPAGVRQASSPYGGNIDNSGFAATDQITVALGPTNFAGTPSIALPALDEAGRRLTSARDSARAVPPGRALLIVLQANANADSLPQLSLMIDGACPLPNALPKNTILTAVGTDLNYAVAPGTHTLGIVTEPRGGGLRNCGQTIAVSVTAGQRYVVFVYGTTTDGFKTLTAPMAAP